MPGRRSVIERTNENLLMRGTKLYSYVGPLAGIVLSVRESLPGHNLEHIDHEPRTRHKTDPAKVE